MTVKLIKNNPNWVKKDLLDMILVGVGEQRPLIDEHDEPWKRDQWQRWLNTGYDMKGVGWNMFYWHHLGMASPDELSLPIDVTADRIEWWFCKINPCSVFPMHVDAFKTECKNFRRFSMPMQDYVPGHIFIYEGANLENYQAGDVFEFDNPRAWHGAANISTEPKVSFQFVCYDL
jgi:hypothetical protein